MPKTIKPNPTKSIHDRISAAITSATAYPIEGIGDVYFRSLSTAQALELRKLGDRDSEKAELKMMQFISELCYDRAGPGATPLFTSEVKFSSLPFELSKPIMEAFTAHMGAQMAPAVPLVESELSSLDSPPSVDSGTSTN